MSSVWNCIIGLLRRLGLLSKPGKLLLLGLDNAGKTALLDTLKNQKGQLKPTTTPTSCKVRVGTVTYTATDLGGDYKGRQVWKDYFLGMKAIVYVIDASDMLRFPESQQELSSLLENEQIANCPILILGNKTDLPDAASEEELRAFFRLKTTGKGRIPRSQLSSRPVELFMCSVLKHEGYIDGFRWLSQFIE